VSIPVVDLEPFRHGSAADRRRVAREVDDACREVGFLTIVGHGVDDGLMADSWARAQEFFDLPVEARLTVQEPYPGYPYGYRPFQAETLYRSVGAESAGRDDDSDNGVPPDLKETYNLGPVDPPPRPLEEMTDPDERAVYAPNLWPDEVAPEFRPTFVAYYHRLAELAAELMAVFAAALDLPSDWFEPAIDRHGSALRLAHYPALTDPPVPGQLRAGAHTDYGTLTILRADDEHPGLQVLAGEDWVTVPALPGGFVVNLGDLMARWTNDRWRSTLHRVVVADGEAGHRRLSIPFFHNANWDARVECIPTCLAEGEQPRYDPVLAGPHLMAKFRSTVV
jgi:isopenicillin N synthase-like dioxygenase